MRLMCQEEKKKAGADQVPYSKVKERGRGGSNLVSPVQRPVLIPHSVIGTEGRLSRTIAPIIDVAISLNCPFRRLSRRT